MVKAQRNTPNGMEQKMANLEISRLAQHFYQCYQAEGKSSKTIKWYAEMLKSFSRFLETNGKPKVLSQLTLINGREFVLFEQERGMAATTVQTKVRALKGFCSWLYQENYIKENTYSALKIPKAPLKVIEPLTTEEINKLIAAKNPLTARGSRDIAILTTLIGTGLRSSELCNLRFDDAHIDEGYFKVMGKGAKERVVPIGTMIQKVIWRYVYHFRPDPLGVDEDYLFLSNDGIRLQSNAIKLMIRRWGKLVDIPRIHPHLCRHTFATNFLIYECGDVFRLQQILGHTTLEMVRRYVHYASTKTMIQGYVSSPVDKMGIKNLRSYNVDKALNRRQTRKRF